MRITTPPKNPESPLPFDVDQKRFERLRTELNSAVSGTPTADLNDWVRRIPINFSRCTGRRVKNIGVLAKTAGRFVHAEATGSVQAARNGDLGGHLGERGIAASRAARDSYAQGQRVFRTLAESAASDPKETLPKVALGVFGFVIGSGGLDGDGGVPDLDLLGGIGAHRSIFTHSIISGVAIETLLVSMTELVEVVYPNLPSEHDRLWDDMRNKSESLLSSLQKGVSAGISYHLGVDASLDAAGTYKDIPVSAPQEAHTIIMGGNAVAEGADAARKDKQDDSQRTAQSGGERYYGTYEEAKADAMRNPGDRITRGGDGGYVVSARKSSRR